MSPEEIREQIVRIEGFSDGIKSGANLFAKWLADKLNAEAKSGIDPNQGRTPPDVKAGDN